MRSGIEADIGRREIDAPDIARWTSCFEDAATEGRFRQGSLHEQQSRAAVFAWIIAIVPALQLYGEARLVLHGDRSLFIELVPRLLCSLGSLLFIARIRQIKRYVQLDRWSTAYGVCLICFTLYLMIVRPQLSSTMLLAGLIGSVAVIYFFVPLTVVRVSMLGLAASLSGGLTCIYLRGELRAEWLQLLLWMVALNAFGYFGIRSQNANLRRIFWQNEELSRRKSELESAYHQERASFRRFLQFAELIGHEFRNSLAVIKGKAQLMQLAVKLGMAPDADGPAVIESAVNRMDDLFSRWLASDLMVETDFVPRLRRTSLRDFLDRVAAETPSSALHPLCFHQVPDLDLDIDPELLMIALQNIIGNAVKYSPGGGPVDVRARAVADHVEIAIADHGMGISASERELVFDKYFRSHYDNGIQGLGLGLYMVRRIVTLHGGTVRAEDNAGAGAVLIISLPCLAGARLQ